MLNQDVRNILKEDNHLGSETKNKLKTLNQKYENQKCFIDFMEDANEKIEKKIMRSPLVGIFYRRKSSDNKPFVEVGDIVKKGDVICLVEAMKTFTEVIADFDGKISEFCIDDGEIIEFSQPILKYVP